MPIHEIKINEYECSQCGYRWINRINYKDGPIPKNCAKCKRETWNREADDRMDGKMNGYRRIIRGFKQLYNDFDEYHLRNKALSINWPTDLCHQFLDMNPRPNIYHLEKVVHSSPIKRYNNGKAIYRRRGWVPDPKNPLRFIRDPSTYEPVPNKPGYVRWKRGVYDDPKFVSDYDKWIIKEADIRKKLMIEIMKNRGIEYKLVTNDEDLKKYDRENGGKYMSLEEKLWRRRISAFHKQYVDQPWGIEIKLYINWPIDLCQKFLSIKPRPTVEEMKDIFYHPSVKECHKLEWDDKAESETLLKTLPDSMQSYLKGEILDGNRRKKLMIRVIQSRGENYTYSEDLNRKILQEYHSK